MIRCLENAM